LSRTDNASAGEGRAAASFTRRLIKEWLVSALVAGARGSLLEREGEPHDRLRALVAGVFQRGHTARRELGVRASRPARR
jgi:cytochrome P450